MIRALLFDWGNTLMVDDGRQEGPMCRWPRVKSVPHARSALRALSRDYLIALATNADDSHEAEIRAALKRVHLDRLVERVYCSNDVGARKPSEAFFAHVIRSLSLPPRAIVMIGDSLQNDVRGALGCGLRALWYAPAGAGMAPPGVARFSDLLQLPELLARLDQE